MLCEDLWVPLQVMGMGYRVGFASGVSASETESGREWAEYRRRSRIMGGNMQILARLGEVWLKEI